MHIYITINVLIVYMLLTKHAMDYATRRTFHLHTRHPMYKTPFVLKKSEIFQRSVLFNF